MNTIVRFDRNTSTGEIKWQGVVGGIGGAFNVAVSPDSRSVYVTGNSGNSIVHLEQTCK